MSQSYLIRPVCRSDGQDLLDLVKQSTGGLSSLQPRRSFLDAYIAGSEASFAGTKPLEAPHKYLMVMEDPADRRLIGCSAVKTQVGTDSPFINFDLKGDGLDQYLEASSRFTGATEVGSLFLDREYRRSGLGRYLAKVRYLLMGTEPWRFGDSVIAELRGTCGADGSPLYDYLFQDKLEKTFLEADAEYFDRNPDALGDIVPLGRIPTALMPQDVRASLGHPHPTGVGAMRLLQTEGFIFSGTIDLFDAGPIMCAYQDTIRTVIDSFIVPTALGEPGDEQVLVSVGEVANFRAVVTTATVSHDYVVLSAQALSDLEIDTDTPVRCWRSRRPAKL